MNTETLRLFGDWFVVIAGLVFMGWFLWRIVYLSVAKNMFVGITRKHFPAIVGLPLAAIASLFLVLVSENQFGPIAFQGLGFRFEGAAGPVVLWILCFLGMAIAIRLLWPCTVSERDSGTTK